MAACLMLCDIFTLHFSYFLALWVRFDCLYTAIPKNYLHAYIYFILPYSVGSVVLFWAFRMYKSMWRFASYRELLRTFFGSARLTAISVSRR